MSGDDSMNTIKNHGVEESATLPDNPGLQDDSEKLCSHSCESEFSEYLDDKGHTNTDLKNTFPENVDEQQPDTSFSDSQYRNTLSGPPKDSGCKVASVKNVINKQFIKIMAVVLACTMVIGGAILGRHLWSKHHPTVIDGIYDISDIPIENQAFLRRSFRKALPLGAAKYRSNLLRTETTGNYFNVTKVVGAREEYAYKDNTPWGVEQNNIYILRHGSVHFYSYSPTLKSLTKDENGTSLKDYGNLLDQNSVKQFRLQTTKAIYKCTLFEISTYLSNIATSSDGSIISASDVSSITQNMTDGVNVKVNEKGDPESSYDKVFRTKNYYINISLSVEDDMPIGAISIVDENAKQAQNAVMPGNHPFPDKTIESVPETASRESTDSDSEQRHGEPMDDKEYRASQFNPKTALSKAYWSCTPQSRMLNFDFELTEHEHMVYMGGIRDWSDETPNRHTVTCITDSLGLPTEEIDGYIEKSFSESNPTNTLKYQNYSLIWRISDKRMTFTIQD